MICISTSVTLLLLVDLHSRAGVALRVHPVPKGLQDLLVGPVVGPSVLLGLRSFHLNYKLIEKVGVYLCFCCRVALVPLSVILHDLGEEHYEVGDNQG